MLAIMTTKTRLNLNCPDSLILVPRAQRRLLGVICCCTQIIFAMTGSGCSTFHCILLTWLNCGMMRILLIIFPLFWIIASSFKLLNFIRLRRYRLRIYTLQAAQFILRTHDNCLIHVAITGCAVRDVALVWHEDLIVLNLLPALRLVVC